jgi:hypothetical protein
MDGLALYIEHEGVVGGWECERRTYQCADTSD